MFLNDLFGRRITLLAAALAFAGPIG